jgi:nickel/cobalt exporter
MTVVLALILGLLQGLRHAFEPDHVVAVSTMISEQRSTRARTIYAVSWGLGHASMLVIVGGILMVFRSGLPPRLDAAFEVAVSLMLMGLGVRAILLAWRLARCAPVPDDGPAPPPARGWRSIGPLAMGMVHGLAGSGALTALVVARLPSPFVGVAFMLIFGAGATLGMSLLAGVAGVPLTRVMRTQRGMPLLLASTGSVSLVLGVSWIGAAVERCAGL